MLISSVNFKGGQGKSLWAAILAGWLDAELLDLDPRQGDAHDWAEKAGRKSRLIWTDYATVLRQASIDPKNWFVADCPPHEGEETRAALRYSHLVVVPVVPSGAQDARAWGRMTSALAEAKLENPGLKVAAVLNANRQTALAKEFLVMLKEWHQPKVGQAVLGVVPQRVALAEAFGAGEIPKEPSIDAVLSKLKLFAKQ